MFLPPIWQFSKHYKLFRVIAYIVQVTIYFQEEHIIWILGTKHVVYTSFQSEMKNAMQSYSIWRAYRDLRYSKHKQLELLILSPGNLWCPLNLSNTRWITTFHWRREKGEKELWGNTCVYMKKKGKMHLRCISVTLESFLSELSKGEISESSWLLCLPYHLYPMDIQGYASPFYHLYSHCLLFI